MKQLRFVPFLSVTIAVMTGVVACGGSTTPISSTKIEDKISSGKALASKGGVEVHEGYLQLLQQVNPSLESQLKTPGGKKRLVDNLLEQEALYQASVKRGIPKLPEYQEKAALYERVIFSQGVIEEEINKKAKEYYQENKDKEFSQVQVSHILLRVQAPNPNAKDEAVKKGVSEAEALEHANAAKKKLDEGVAWEEVVTEFSDDRMTKPKGGDLGKINREDRRAARLEWQNLIDQAFKMKQGEISAPIKAKDGYHIIKITEAASVAPYEEVESRIQFKLRGTVKKDVLAEVSSGETKYLDEELKKAAEGQPGVPGAFPGVPHGVAPSPQASPKPITKPAAAAPAPKPATPSESKKAQ